MSDLEFWVSAPNRELLVKCLNFLTGDFWEFSFEASLMREQQQSLFHPPSPTVVCLYSGGLDSAAGLVATLAEGKDVLPVLVRHRSDQADRVRRQLACIRLGYSGLYQPLVFPFEMKTPRELTGHAEETTQRSRSFLFSCVGGVAAMMSGTDVLSVFEAGIGAVNLPLMSGMLGSKATRSCHPTFTRLMSALLSAVAGRAILIAQPFLGMTKGELVKVMVSEGAGWLAKQTQSCLHPLREEFQKQCGVCPACIFRRQALAVAGIAEDAGTYMFDMFDAATTSRREFRRKSEFLRAFLMQIEGLSLLDEGDELPGFLRRHLQSTGLVVEGSVGVDYAAVYRRYRKEWLAIAEEGLRRGLVWARLLARHDPGS